MTDDGVILCEYCGKPIVKAYDMIGHHKIELTEENVNDYEVSLNPDNIAFVHHRCHNYIHNKLGYACRKVYLVHGAPMAGKSEFARSNMNEGDLLLDIDTIWQSVSGCERYIKPKRLNAVVFRVRDTLLDSVKYRVGKWRNAYIVGTYPLTAERERLCKELGAEEIYIDATKEECIERLKALQISNEEEYLGYIEKYFEDTRPLSF